MSVKRRKDSFFGLHFDFHAEPEKCKSHIMGENLNEEDIRKICREVNPDFIQIDCKGHPGYASYPSKLGNAMPNFAKDTLKLWRKVTKEENVALYMHYSGVYDARYLSLHPTHGVKKADGTYSDTDVSTFSPYVDDLMIPQLLEVASYGVDGVWVDGECWATKADFCDKALDEFRQETGIDVKDNPPVASDMPYYQEYREFCRNRFRKQLNHYAQKVHKVYPDFQIASNWAYTEQMPEKVTTQVDFLSGDYSPANSVNQVSFSVRIIAAQDMPWDLMSWGFRQNWQNDEHCNKHPLQLMQEAAAVICMGGAYQNYIMQRRDTSPKVNCALQMAQVAKFCREREPYCFKGKNVPQVVIFNSTADHYRAIPNIFGNGETYRSIKGWCNILLYSGHSFEIRQEHNLFDRLNDYPVVVVPEAQTYFDKETAEKLINYAAEGGTLVLSGIKTLKQFKESVKIIDFSNISKRDINNNISVGDGFWSSLPTAFCEIKGGNIMAYASETEDGENNRLPVMAGYPLGKGNIIAIGTDIGFAANEYMTVTYRQIGEKLFDFYKPFAKVHGSRHIEYNLLSKDGKIYAQFVNLYGDHGNDRVYSFDEIPKIHGIRLELAKMPKSVIWQPEGKALSPYVKDGAVFVDLPPLHIHDILEIEQ